MNKTEIRCPNCQTSFLIGNGGNAVTELSDGIHYLVPETIRNEHNCSDKSTSRMAALRDAGINVTKLQSLMQSNADLKDIFASDDPVIEEINKGGFIDNPELFRRWICAQTMRLMKDKQGWTHAVRKTYDMKYVLNQSKRELKLLCQLKDKHRTNDIRFQFFTLDDLKEIFSDLMLYNNWYLYRDEQNKANAQRLIEHCASYKDLLEIVNNITWKFRWDCSFKPKAWLNCFKGAGAYYTLQNLIRTHGLVLADCNDMNDSLKTVEDVFNSIIKYPTNERRWDIMLSVLTKAIDVRRFELKY